MLTGIQRIERECRVFGMKSPFKNSSESKHRIGCYGCGTKKGDGLTLPQAKRAGWKKLGPTECDPGFDWPDYLGLCPKCVSKFAGIFDDGKPLDCRVGTRLISSNGGVGTVIKIKPPSHWIQNNTETGRVIRRGLVLDIEIRMNSGDIVRASRYSPHWRLMTKEEYNKKFPRRVVVFRKVKRADPSH